MQAVYYEQFQQSPQIVTVPDPTPGVAGVVIQVHASGICRSDWHGWMGHDNSIRLPHVPGHEFSGTIVATGAAVKNWKTGDRVTVPFVCGCGSCEYCAAGDAQVCPAQTQPGFTHWGSFAEYVAIEQADWNVVRLPEEIDFVTAASLGCRLATAYRGLIEQGKLSAGQTMAVFGCGGVGLSAIQIGRAVGANVAAVDIDESKLQKARQLGADATFLLAVGDERGDERLRTQLQEWSGGGVHFAVEAFGSRQTCLNAIGSLRRRGKLLQIGLLLGEDSRIEIPMARVIAEELELIGCHGMSASSYGGLLQLIQTRAIQPAELIGTRISLAEAPQKLMELSQFIGTGMTIIDQLRME